MFVFCMAVTIVFYPIFVLCMTHMVTRLLQYNVLPHVHVLYGRYNKVFCPIFVLCMTYKTVTIQVCPMSVYCMAVTIQCSVPCLCTVWLLKYSVLSHLCVMHDLQDCYNTVVCPMSVFCVADVVPTMQCSVPCLCFV